MVERVWTTEHLVKWQPGDQQLAPLSLGDRLPGLPVNAVLAQLELPIQGMTCACCASRIEPKVNNLDGVSATVNGATEKACVEHDPAAVFAATVRSLVRAFLRARQ
jgi:copper chaperone CopZ